MVVSHISVPCLNRRRAWVQESRPCSIGEAFSVFVVGVVPPCGRRMVFGCCGGRGWRQG